MKKTVRALLVATFAATFRYAADNNRAKQMTAARAEFFKADKVVRIEIEVDESGTKVSEDGITVYSDIPLVPVRTPSRCRDFARQHHRVG